jgi:hypothetical protein
MSAKIKFNIALALQQLCDEERQQVLHTVQCKFGSEETQPWCLHISIMKTLEHSRLTFSDAEGIDAALSTCHPGLQQSFRSGMRVPEWELYLQQRLQERKVVVLVTFEDGIPSLADMRERELRALLEDRDTCKGSMFWWEAIFSVSRHSKLMEEISSETCKASDERRVLIVPRRTEMPHLVSFTEFKNILLARGVVRDEALDRDITDAWARDQVTIFFPESRRRVILFSHIPSLLNDVVEQERIRRFDSLGELVQQ